MSEQAKIKVTKADVERILSQPMPDIEIEDGALELIVSQSPDLEIANLEWEVCETAVAFRKVQIENNRYPMRYPNENGLAETFFVAKFAATAAVDALIAAREEAENE